MPTQCTKDYPSSPFGTSWNDSLRSGPLVCGRGRHDRIRSGRRDVEGQRDGRISSVTVASFVSSVRFIPRRVGVMGASSLMMSSLIEKVPLAVMATVQDWAPSVMTRWVGSGWDHLPRVMRAVAKDWGDLKVAWSVMVREPVPVRE